MNDTRKFNMGVFEIRRFGCFSAEWIKILNICRCLVVAVIYLPGVVQAFISDAIVVSVFYFQTLTQMFDRPLAIDLAPARLLVHRCWRG